MKEIHKKKGRLTLIKSKLLFYHKKKKEKRMLCPKQSNKMAIQPVRGNGGKERPGSIVTKTLKYGILIPIVTSKESHFNAAFKYISFIKFSITHQKLRA